MGNEFEAPHTMERRLINPASTVDLIDEDEEGILFVKRKNEPFKDYWALPGGFLGYGIEDLSTAAIREYFEETGYKTRQEDLILIGVYSDPNRDPRGHVISHAFYVRKKEGTAKAGDDAAEVRRFPRGNLPELAFDHRKILEDYFNKLTGGK